MTYGNERNLGNNFQVSVVSQILVLFLICSLLSQLLKTSMQMGTRMPNQLAVAGKTGRRGLTKFLICVCYFAYLAKSSLTVKKKM